MPLRYSKTLRRIFNDIAEMQRRGQLDETADEKSREYFHKNRKALRELQRLQSRDPTERTEAWAEHFSSPQYSVEATVFAVLSDLKQVRVRTADGHQYAIVEKTPGIDWKSLYEGQHVECIVTTAPLPRVIKLLSKKERN